MGLFDFSALAKESGQLFKTQTHIHTMKNSTPLIVTLISTLVFSLLSYFGYSPDPQLSSDTIQYADQAVQAISAKNWIMLGTTVVSFVAVVYVWWKGRTAAARGASVVIVLIVASLQSCRSDLFHQSESPVPVTSRTQTPRFPVKFFLIEGEDIGLAMFNAGIKNLPVGEGEYIWGTTDGGKTVGNVESMLTAASIDFDDVTLLSASTTVANGNTYYYPDISTGHIVYERLDYLYDNSEAMLKALTVASPMLHFEIGGVVRPITVPVEAFESCETTPGCEVVNNSETDNEDLCVCGGLAFLWDPWTYYDEED